VIVDAARTPIGRRFGSLSGWHPAELAAEALRGIVDRTGLDPTLVEDVIVGCVTQVGAQSTNIARSAILAAGWPEEVPGTTVDRQCGSSQQAVHFAAQGVMAGAYDVVVAAGIECMSTVPMFSNAVGNLGDPYGPVLAARYAHRETFGHRGIVEQGVSAELLVERWGLDRTELDGFALESHRRAAAARDTGRFDAELVPVEGKRRDRDDAEHVEPCAALTADEGIRDTSLEKLADLKPVFLPSGQITAGNSSQISDGAAAVLIMAEERAEALGLPPLARFVGFGVVGSDPIEMLTGPIPATRKVLDGAGIGIDDVDLYEVNEAFAPVPMVWARELGADPERLNVNGGAIALGHPLGASGARLLVTLVHELQRRGGRYGLQAICEGGGMANATLIERTP
jgi:acetyl-CoA acetyltransferase family protein